MVPLKNSCACRQLRPFCAFYLENIVAFRLAVVEDVFLDLIFEFPENALNDAGELLLELHDHRHDDGENENVLGRGLARVVENEFFQCILIHRF